jgi:AGCS family alanine or glycine:cation symporter
MAAPNLIALLALSPIVFRLTKDYFAAEKAAIAAKAGA